MKPDHRWYKTHVYTLLSEGKKLNPTNLMFDCSSCWLVWERHQGKANRWERHDMYILSTISSVCAWKGGMTPHKRKPHDECGMFFLYRFFRIFTSDVLFNQSQKNQWRYPSDLTMKPNEIRQPNIHENNNSNCAWLFNWLMFNRFSLDLLRKLNQPNLCILG